MSDLTTELAEIARIMSEHRLDSVKLPNGLEVLKTTHPPFEGIASVESVNEGVERRLEAMGLVNATEESGRVPIDPDDILFAASRAQERAPEDFRRELGQDSQEAGIPGGAETDDEPNE